MKHSIHIYNFGPVGEEEYVQSEYDSPRIVHHKSSNYPDD